MQATIWITVIVLLAAFSDQATEEVNWDNLKLLGQQLQSGIDKKNPGKAKYFAELIIKALPSDETTYYAGVRTGQEVSLTMGAASTIIGSSADIRVNQWTRAAGEYLSIDRYIPGLTLLVTGEEVLSDLMEFGWSYRMHPSGHHPVYAATKTLPGKGGHYTGGRMYNDQYAAHYDNHVKQAMVAVHPHQTDIETMSKHDPINIVYADLTPRSVGGRIEHILVVKAHETVQGKNIKAVWGDKTNCETCNPDYQVFLNRGENTRPAPR
uniref:Capsid protein n=1 Tax=Jingmen tick virus TaxID=1172985 RepID=A0A5P8N739_9FLAV|nr:capsid protein [Jingmen tick virus]